MNYNNIFVSYDVHFESILMIVDFWKCFSVHCDSRSTFTYFRGFLGNDNPVSLPSHNYAYSVGWQLPCKISVFCPVIVNSKWLPWSNVCNKRRFFFFCSVKWFVFYGTFLCLILFSLQIFVLHCLDQLSFFSRLTATLVCEFNVFVSFIYVSILFYPLISVSSC